MIVHPRVNGMPIQNMSVPASMLFQKSKRFLSNIKSSIIKNEEATSPDDSYGLKLLAPGDHPVVE